MGTEPGQLERQPELEPRLQRLALGAFEIDAHLYPGGSEPPLLGLPRARAMQLCSERKGRLCTELEWERACKGPESLPFPTGQDFDPSCLSDASACPSGFGVLGMGSLREWTASELQGSKDPEAVLRGASKQQPPAQHRCAHRASTPVDTALADVGFRCCHGAPNAARVGQAALGTTFTKFELPLSELGKLLEADAVTRALAANVAYFQEPEAVETVLAKGPGDTQGFLLTVMPLLWSPALGAEFLVLSARSGTATSFVVVYHALGDRKFRLASSFIMQGEPGPIVLAYNGYIRPRLHFSSCWGCPGETGKILYRDPDRAVILQP
jgi:hypothetical protein